MNLDLLAISELNTLTTSQLSALPIIGGTVTPPILTDNIYYPPSAFDPMNNYLPYSILKTIYPWLTRKKADSLAGGLNQAIGLVRW